MIALAKPKALNPLAPLIAKIHVAAKDLRLADDTRRALMVRVTGKASTKDMDAAELSAVIAELQRQGWRPTAKGGSKPAARTTRRPADHPVARKARAMWISLHQLGAVRNPSDAALEAFACRQLRVEVFQWADQGQGFKLIEALKAMAEKAGWSQEVSGIPGSRQVRVLRERLAVAQAAKIRARGILVSPEELLTGKLRAWSSEDLQMEITAMGHTIRAFTEPVFEG